MAFSTTAAQRGHKVTLFEASDEIGGHFNLAKRISGKEEFYETLRYYKKMLEIHKVDIRLGHRVNADIFARQWGIDFENHPRGGVAGVQPMVEHADI